MELVSGTYHDGHVDLGRPVNWPDGTAVSVARTPAAGGMTEADWPRDPEGIERLLREWEGIQPLVFTAAEAADFAAARKLMGRMSVDKLDRLADAP